MSKETVDQDSKQEHFQYLNLTHTEFGLVSCTDMIALIGVGCGWEYAKNLKDFRNRVLYKGVRRMSIVHLPDNASKPTAFVNKALAAIRSNAQLSLPSVNMQVCFPVCFTSKDEGINRKTRRCTV
ncbi:hypothetical protein PoB_004362600 [Plakobranchus ocellatus]|uniref:Uncharacterized protein n=1 Tax=Plakobranchus ocellatus TaxID=259542 RepID=A0AAV4B9J7_9GAST|nr:hypothetical protein PoB_004362600 [Plakobranchus ocellatus]